MASKEDLLKEIEAKSQELQDAIGAELFESGQFRIEVDGLTVQAKSDTFGIDVIFWGQKDGVRVPAWQIFHSWKPKWDNSGYVALCWLEHIERSKPEELRQAIETMIAKVEAYIDLNPKPPSFIDRIVGLFR